MPKIPTYVSEGGISGVAQPMPHGAYPDTGLAKPFEALTQTAVDATGAFFKAKETARQADEKLDMEAQFNAMKEDIAKREVWLRAQGGNPDQYPDALKQQMTDALSIAEKNLKYPESKAKFRGLTGGWFTGKIVDSQFDAEKIRHAQMEVTAGIANREDANTAVYGSPAEAEAARARFAARTQYLVNTGVYSGAKGAQITQGFLDDIEVGSATRDFKDPKLRPQVEAGLMRGEYKLAPDKQQAVLKTLQTDARQEETRLREEQERQRQERVSEAEKGVRDAVSGRRWDDASKILDDYRADFKGTEYNTWRDIVEKAKVDKQSDPEARRRIANLVYEIDSPEKADRARAELRKEQALGRINFTDGDKYDNDIQGTKQALKNRREDKALDARERQYSDTKTSVRESVRVTSPTSPLFNQRAQTILEMAEDELARHREDADGGAEWWRKNKAFYVGRVSDAAKERVTTLKSFVTWKGSHAELLAQIQAERNPATRQALLTQAKTLKEIEDLQLIMNPTKPETTTTTPSAPAKYTPAPGGK